MLPGPRLFTHLLPSDNGKVCRNMLLVECASEVFEGSLERLCSVNCFRLSLSPGNSKVIATKVSSFDTLRFDYTNYSKWIISDHSGKYYAVYSGAEGALQIWDIGTGKLIRQIPNARFPKILKVVKVMVIAKQGPDGPQQVVVAGNDGRENWRPRRAQALDEWGYVTEFKVFPIDAGSSESTGCVEELEKQQGRSCSPPRGASLLASSFKVPRYPAGITTSDTPGAPGYLSEEIGLALWNVGAGNVYSFYSTVTPDHPPVLARDAPLAVEREFRMAAEHEGDSGFYPFRVGSRSGLALTIDFSGYEERSWGRKRVLYQLSIRSFYPSATPGVMDLEWESCLKSPGDRGKTRGLFLVNTSIFNFTHPTMLTDENGLGTAFLEVIRGGTDLVLVLWEDGFHGELPLGGKVLN